MEKKNWFSFLDAKIKSQISVDGMERTEKWGFFLLFVFALGLGFGAVSKAMGRSFLYETKVLFLILGHLIAVFGFYLPVLWEKGGKPLSRALKVRNFSGLVLSVLVITGISVILSMLGQQVFAAGQEGDAPMFFMLVAAANLITVSLYLVGGLVFLSAISFFPQLLSRVVEHFGRKTQYSLTGTHAVLAVLLGMSYAEAVPVGSQAFFDELRVAGLFWIALLSFLFFVGRSLMESPLAALSDIEFELASGRLERHEDILVRYKEAFVSRRLTDWLHQIGLAAAAKVHEIAAHTHEALDLIGSKKPSEMDLRKVEEHYKKVDGIYRRLDKDNSRFLVCINFFDASEAEREKIEELRDRFSRDLRNSKIELASVRKQIDDRLLAIKNHQSTLPIEVPVEKVPLSN